MDPGGNLKEINLENPQTGSWSGSRPGLGAAGGRRDVERACIVEGEQCFLGGLKVVSFTTPTCCDLELLLA